MYFITLLYLKVNIYAANYAGFAADPTGEYG
jgi:hypothetical protein